MADHERAAQIRALNDQMRTNGPLAASHNRWVITPGVVALGPQALEALIETLRKFSDFTEDNDPYGEHDFGSIEIEGERVFWKIDYYDRTLTEGSGDAADEAVTCRVLTLMLAMEY